MRAVVFDRPGAVRMADLPEPALEEPGDAIVDVSLSAICGSDLHLYHGRMPIEPAEPLGHEAVGVVGKVGPGVERHHPGDRVVVAFAVVCGTCWYCRNGEPSLCGRLRNIGFGRFGGGLGGAQAERLRVPVADVNLLAVPDDVSDEAALMVGDVLTTGYYGASLAAIHAGETVGVVGVGPVGFFCIQAARSLGAVRVFALDRSPERLALAAAAGAVPVAAGEGSMAVVRELTEGRGADAAVEAVGTLAAYEVARSVVRRGGRIVLLGVHGDEHLDVPLGAYWLRRLTLFFAGVCPVQAVWERAVAELRKGSMRVEPLISHRLPLELAPEGYSLFDRKEATKVLLTARGATRT
jgi:threonine dehydrogenase-like Zn-dependent dehydrogenase